MIRLCFWCILISTAALALIAAVMQGFEQVTTQKLQGIHADLIVRSYDPGLHYQNITAMLHKEFSHEIIAMSPSSTHHLLVTCAKNDAPLLAITHAINPQTLAHVSTLPSMIIHQTAEVARIPFTQLFAGDQVLIGKELASQLDVHVGDPITFWIPLDTSTAHARIAFSHMQAHIGGIFATGIDEFDSAGIFASEQLVYKKMGLSNTITHLYLKVDPTVAVSEVKQKLAKKLAPVEVVSWQDLYASLVSALVLEKYAMIIILSLILLVASMNIISLLFMYLTSKKRTLAILFSMGLSQRQATATFTIMGFIISCSATCIGLAVAIITSFIIDHYQCISLPDVYYSTYLPAHMDWSIILTTFALVLILSILTTWYPTRQIKRMDISRILKFEV